MTDSVGSLVLLFQSIEKAKKVYEMVVSDENGGSAVFLDQEEIQRCVDPKVLSEDPDIKIGLRVFGPEHFLGKLISAGS